MRDAQEEEMLVSLLLGDVENIPVRVCSSCLCQTLNSPFDLIFQSISLTISYPSSKDMISFDLKRWF